MGTLFTVASPSALTAVVAGVISLTPGTAWSLWLAFVGAIIVISAILGGVNSSQRRRRRA
jgi:hypothetical protein